MKGPAKPIILIHYLLCLQIKTLPNVKTTMPYFSSWSPQLKTVVANKETEVLIDIRCSLPSTTKHQKLDQNWTNFETQPLPKNHCRRQWYQTYPKLPLSIHLQQERLRKHPLVQLWVQLRHQDQLRKEWLCQRQQKLALRVNQSIRRHQVEHHQKNRLVQLIVKLIRSL